MRASSASAAGPCFRAASLISAVTLFGVPSARPPVLCPLAMIEPRRSCRNAVQRCVYLALLWTDCPLRCCRACRRPRRLGEFPPRASRCATHWLHPALAAPSHCNQAFHWKPKLQVAVKERVQVMSAMRGTPLCRPRHSALPSVASVGYVIRGRGAISGRAQLVKEQIVRTAGKCVALRQVGQSPFSLF